MGKRRLGGYLGGSTVIGPASSWFSHKTSPNHKWLDGQDPKVFVVRKHKNVFVARKHTKRKPTPQVPAYYNAAAPGKSYCSRNARDAAEVACVWKSLGLNASAYVVLENDKNMRRKVSVTTIRATTKRLLDAMMTTEWPDQEEIGS